ncbi:MAG: ATP-binding protein [Deltaproteobacteria bacterium]|nr:ATP-binding protein [Deltaproteobacteria bacterium]
MSHYTTRYVEPQCRKALSDGKILVIIGARQTGKSTLARHLIEDLPETDQLVLNLDDPFLRDRLSASEGGIVAEIEKRADRPWSAIRGFLLVIDEAQKAPSLFERIKALHDEFPERIRFIVTGSSALEIHDPVAESLAGRARIVRLHPFTLSEGLSYSTKEDPARDHLPELVSRLLGGRFTSRDFDTLVERGKWHASRRKRWVETHLRHPLFPEPCDAAEPEEWIRDFLATYVEKDVRSLASVGNLDLFRACIRQVAARTGSTLKWETMANEIGTTPVTLRRYVGLMEQTLTLLRLQPFVVNPVKRIVRAPKLYLSDPGMLWGLRGFEDLRILRASGMIGNYMELLAITEVAKWCSLEPTAPVLRFWFKTKVSEVDLIVSNRGFHIPIEIKLGSKFNQSWLRGLDAFDADHRKLDVEIPYRVILHMGEPARPDARTFVLPLWMLA